MSGVRQVDNPTVVSNKYEIMLVGPQSTGKTAVAKRFVKNTFTSTYDSTIGVDFDFKNVEMDDGTVTLKINDTNGLEKYRSMLSIFCRRANVLLAFYDVTNPQSLEDISDVLEKCVERIDSQSCLIVLVGNKTDLTEQPRVSNSDIQLKLQQIQRDLNLPQLPLHYQVSAKTGYGVNGLFTGVAHCLLTGSRIFPEALQQRVAPSPAAPTKRKIVSDRVVPINSEVAPDSVPLTSRMNVSAAIVTATLLIGAMVIFGAMLWPLIVALSVIKLVLLALAAVFFVTTTSFGASLIVPDCSEESSSEYQPYSGADVAGIYRGLGHDESSSRSEEEIELDDAPPRSRADSGEAQSLPIQPTLTDDNHIRFRSANS